MWSGWETENGFAVHGCVSSNRRVRMLRDDLALFLHDVTSTIELDGDISTVKEQETIVFAKTGDRWVAVHEHLSPVEPLAEA